MSILHRVVSRSQQTPHHPKDAAGGLHTKPEQEARREHSFLCQEPAKQPKAFTLAWWCVVDLKHHFFLGRRAG
jgi:hypothetical protein